MLVPTDKKKENVNIIKKKMGKFTLRTEKNRESSRKNKKKV